MDAEAALDELMELSTQVLAAAIVGANGEVEASTPPGVIPERLVRCGLELLEAAAAVRPDGPEVTRAEVALRAGSLIAVREGGRTIAATTVPDPIAGLAVYDLRTALRRLEDDDA